MYTPEQLEQFLLAAQKGPLKNVQRLMAKFEIPINAQKNISLCTALHRAMRAEQFEVAAYLIDNGANPLLQDAEGNTPVHLLRWCHNAPPRTLLEKIITQYPSIVKIKNRSNDTILHLNSHISAILPQLVAAGLNINAPNAQGCAAIVYAVDTNDPSTLSGLLAHQPDLTVKNFAQQPLLHIAAEKSSSVACLELLVEHVDATLLNATNLQGFTPVHLACLYARARSVQALLNKNVDLSIPNQQGDTLFTSILQTIARVKQNPVASIRTHHLNRLKENASLLLAYLTTHPEACTMTQTEHQALCEFTAPEPTLSETITGYLPSLAGEKTQKRSREDSQPTDAPKKRNLTKELP